MKNEKFTELLNLYLDGALPPSEATAFEREILENPERRKVYRQYCQMQSACSALAGRFRESAAPASTFRQGRVVAAVAAPRYPWWKPLSLAVSGAVAACFVVVVVRQGAGTAPGTEPAAPVAALTHPVSVAPPVTMVVSNSPALLRDPWSSRPVMPSRVMLFERLPETSGPVVLMPPLSQLRDLPELEPATPAPVSPALKVEPIEATAFQYQK